MGAITTLITIVYRSKPMFLFWHYSWVQSTHVRHQNNKHSFVGMHHCIHSFKHFATPQHQSKKVDRGFIRMQKMLPHNHANSTCETCNKLCRNWDRARVRCIIYQFEPAQGAHGRTIDRGHDALTCIVYVSVWADGFLLMNAELACAMRGLRGWLRCDEWSCQCDVWQTCRYPLFHHILMLTDLAILQFLTF